MNTPSQPMGDNESVKARIDAAVDKTKVIPLSQATPLKAKGMAKAKGKQAPTVFRHILKTEWIRSFDWKERLKVLFGAQLVVVMGHATQHNAGVFQPLIVGKVTNDKTPTDFMRRIVNTMLEEQPSDPVTHEPEEAKK